MSEADNSNSERANNHKIFLCNALEKMKFTDKLEEIIDQLIETGEVTLFVGWETRWRKRRVATTLYEKIQNPLLESFKTVKEKTYEGASLKIIPPCDFVFDTQRVKNWDSCPKIHRSWMEVNEILENTKTSDFDNVQEFLENFKTEYTAWVYEQTNTAENGNNDLLQDIQTQACMLNADDISTSINISWNPQAELLSDNIIKSIKQNLKERMENYGLSFDKIETIFNNVYNYSVNNLPESAKITSENNNWPYNKNNTIDINAFVEFFNSNMTKALEEMNKSDKDFDLQNIDISNISDFNSKYFSTYYMRNGFIAPDILENLKPDHFKEALKCFEKEEKMGIILYLTKEEPELFTEFSKDALIFPLKQMDKPDIVKSMNKLEPEDLIKMVQELPDDFLAAVITQIDPLEFAEVLTKSYKDILSEIAIGNN